MADDVPSRLDAIFDQVASGDPDPGFALALEAIRLQIAWRLARGEMDSILACSEAEETG